MRHNSENAGNKHGRIDFVVILTATSGLRRFANDNRREQNPAYITNFANQSARFNRRA
jgi:hypothetical protein